MSVNQYYDGGDLDIGNNSEKETKLEELEICLLNVQGLSQTKMTEIESLLTSPSKFRIFCIIETHQLINKMRIADNTEEIHSFRDKNDKKGGGLQILWKNISGIDKVNIEKLDNKHRDILVANVSIGDLNFKMILSYWATNDRNRNIVIIREIEEMLKKWEKQKIIILGDFNGHTGFLGPQKPNENGQKIINLLENNNLTLLNIDNKCKGEITWTNGIYSSTIDYVLCNENMYESFNCMYIDEQKKITNISDHCRILTGWKCSF